MNITTIKINNEEYVECTKVLEKAPIYSKGSKNTRDLIKNKEIADDMFVFARKNKDNTWTKSADVSARLDKVFLKKEFLINIPELQEKDLGVQIVDENGIPEAPQIIQLSEAEKFKNDTGKIAEIGARGTRTVGGIYFSANDAQKEFELKNLLRVLKDKDSSYEEEVDYKYFTIKKGRIDSQKIVQKKEIFLTYGGMLKVLFASKSGKTKGFIKWATETLFTIQMGTKDQKETLVEGILGIPANTLKNVLSASTTDVPCIYRFALGKCKDLRKIMNLSPDIPDDYTIIKYGRTNDLSERTTDHIKTYGVIKGVKLELMNYAYIDPKYLSKAEVEIKEFFMDIEIQVKYKTHVELVAINPKHEKQIGRQFKFITDQYAGCVKNLMETIESMKKEIEAEKLKSENTERICKLELEKKDEQCKNQLLVKELEYMKMIYELSKKH